jgi:sucrose-phosphate synthase
MHIVFLNPQGNFDQNDSYWTMHPDFGGQLVYVKEIAIEMAKLGHKVDIITRLIDDPSFPEFKEPIDAYHGVDDLRILRVPCGGPTFLRKELLWEHLDEWTNNIIEFYQQEGALFDFATGHYGDGGLACAMIKQKVGIPYSFTGHSLGAQKFDKLNNNFINFVQLEKQYYFTKRILAERTAIRYSDLVFVSTSQERDQQYTHILYQDAEIFSNPLSFIVAPPGANTTVFAPYWSTNVEDETTTKIENTMERDIASSRHDLPFVVLASRLDEKKNHVGLVQAYAGDKELQQRCNLLISLRGVPDAYKDYSMLKPAEITIVDEMMDIIMSTGIKDHVMFMSINSQQELADTYRYMAKRGSVFSLTALYEPFGLAPIEAMSTGLPVAVTMYGGPSDVLQEGNSEFGVLLDVHDTKNIAMGLHKVFDNYEFYQKQGFKRVMDKYTWTATAKRYIEAIIDKCSKRHQVKVELPEYFLSKKEVDLDQSFIKKIYKID